MRDFEKLGLFYLGRPLDPDSGQAVDEPLLYDSRDLVTHAVCLGMTGSGKTGLCIDLLEEAAIDGVPALVIDPKGDLCNLLLTFPDLAPDDFRPWVQEEAARRKGVSLDELAAAEAEKWKRGLAAWGQDGERIRRLRQAAAFRIFTPGSSAGEPISILATFAAPPPELAADAELLADRVESTATSLLGLVGIGGDPLRSREHILVATLLDRAWRTGRGYDLAQLIADVQQPPLERIGVLPVDGFFPAAERFGLAMSLNALLAAPGFELWLEGTPLEVDRLLFAADGRPQVAVLSIAHLSDAERMFFVSLLLNQALAWMRARPGASGLRALLYMDEIFGYLPPTANPPSKKPMLTLLKQARAFGLGVVLATQNPVDLDYKALSNIGTWFLGRLQTERDLARLLDGLEGVGGAGFERQRIAQLLAGLATRRFLLHNVHATAPVLFESRWAMSYLAGPLTREQIRQLGQGQVRTRRIDPAQPADGPAGAAPMAAGAAVARPVLPPEVPQLFLPLRAARPGDPVYRAHLVGLGRVHFEDGKLGVSQRVEVARLAALAPDVPVDWLQAATPTVGEADFESAPAERSTFEEAPAAALKTGQFARWEKAFAEALYRSERLTLWRSPATGELSRVGESERDFRIRVGEVARAERDRELDKVRQRFAGRVDALAERIRRAEERVERERGQATQRKLETAVSVGTTLLGALFGRKRLSTTSLSRAATSARSASRAMKEGQDVGLAEESLESLRQKQTELEREVGDALAEAGARLERASAELVEVAVKPRKADVEVRRVALAWAPYLPDAGGRLTPAWE